MDEQLIKTEVIQSEGSLRIPSQLVVSHYGCDDNKNWKLIKHDFEGLEEFTAEEALEKGYIDFTTKYNKIVLRILDQYGDVNTFTLNVNLKDSEPLKGYGLHDESPIKGIDVNQPASYATIKVGEQLKVPKLINQDKENEVVKPSSAYKLCKVEDGETVSYKKEFIEDFGYDNYLNATDNDYMFVVNYDDEFSYIVTVDGKLDIDASGTISSIKRTDTNIFFRDPIVKIDGKEVYNSIAFIKSRKNPTWFNQNSKTSDLKTLHISTKENTLKIPHDEYSDYYISWNVNSPFGKDLRLNYLNHIVISD